MRRLLYPKSIAVLGVSPKERNLAGLLVKNLVNNDYHGSVYAVGGRHGEMHGQHVYASLEEIPQDIDLAMVLTPAHTIPDLFRQFSFRGISRAVVMSAGFSEYGAERDDLERAVVTSAADHGIRFVGPNCVGIVNTAINFIGFFFPVLPPSTIRPGRVGILAQSGTVAITCSLALSKEGMGISKAVSLGNKLDLDEVDFLRFLMEDEETDVAGVYLEGISRGRELVDVCRKARKPIAVHKAGAGQAGQRAARSHTAALANDDRVVDAAMRQGGVVRVRRIPDLIAAIKALSLPPMRGDNVGVIGPSGGVSVTASDACDYQGFNLPPLPESMLSELEERSPEKVIHRGNPLDFGDMFDNEVFLHALDLLANLSTVDGLLVTVRQPTSFTEDGTDYQTFLAHIRNIPVLTGKPVAATLGGEFLALDQVRRQLGLPVFTYAEECVEALRISREYYERQRIKDAAEVQVDCNRAVVAAILNRASSVGQHHLGHEALDILSAYGIPVAPFRLVSSPDAAICAARELGFPLVAKVSSPDIVHKSDVGGVVVGIKSEEELEQAFTSILTSVHRNQPVARFEGVLLQRMVVDGKELMLGGKQDKHFGPVVMLAIGGIYVEVLDDVALRLAPLSRLQAEQMVRELRGAKLLEGVRGQRSADVASTVDSLVRLGQLLSDFPQIAEIDVNPLKVMDSGLGSVAVDARVILNLE